MNTPDGLLALVSYPVKVLSVAICIIVSTVSDTAGVLVGVRPDLTLILLEAELGVVAAVLEVRNHIVLCHAEHFGLAIETGVEQPDTAEKSLSSILREPRIS